MTSLNNQVLIHIGYHKTGTTFLQRTVFTDDRLFFRVKEKQIQKYFVEPWSFEFNFNEANEFVNNEIKKSGSRLTVFSNERLSGSLHDSDKNSKEISTRLAKCFDMAKILIVIREQKSMIKSSYYHYLKTRGSYSITQYLFPPGSHFSHLNKFKYHYLIQEYYDRFGKENVLVLTYELLQEDQNEFLRQIFNFIDLENEVNLNNIKKTKINEAFPPFILEIKRHLNPYIMKEFRNAGDTFYLRLIKIIFSAIRRILNSINTTHMDNNFNKKISKEINSFCQSRYNDSNNQTQKLTGLDLKKYNYDL